MADELSPRQIEFLRFYSDPKSETFGNALQSALKAGYSQEYSESITTKGLDWMAENVGRRKRMLAKAEARLELLAESEDERISADVSKFLAKTLGKNEGYSERTEVTGKDGQAILVMPSELIQKHEVPSSPESDSAGQA